MGLPTRWNDPQYGVCLTLWAAVAHLKSAGAACVPEARAITYTLSDGMTRRAEAVYIAAAGWVFPMRELEHRTDRSKITHIFFDLHGTLVDGVKLHPCYSEQQGRILAERYGGDWERWAEANRLILQDWDSYYADLDLTGEDGMEHIYEGLYRTTRAHFRLTDTPEPSHDELQTLSRELPGLATWNCNALYPDAKPVIEQLYRAGYTLGLTTHALAAQARGTLHGGGVLDYFKGVIVGVDTLEQFDKDKRYYEGAARLADVSPECCLVVDDVANYVRAAKRVGMWTAFSYRKGAPLHLPNADLLLGATLTPLVLYLIK